MLAINDYELLLSDRHFGYLVLSTVLIAAGGYSINDYFDVKVDRINKIKKVIVDRFVKRRVAMMLHLVLTGLGFVTRRLSLMGHWTLAVDRLVRIRHLHPFGTTLQPFSINFSPEIWPLLLWLVLSR